MQRLLAALVISTSLSAADWVTTRCEKLSEFRQTWLYIIRSEPYLTQEMESIEKESATEITHIIENGTAIAKLVPMNSCTITVPMENGLAVDGLRTLITYKTWTRNNRHHARGILVDYLWKRDPNTMHISRRFVSVAVCRDVESCQKRKIIAQPTTPDPTPVQPDPTLIPLEPSPQRPKPKP